MIDYSKFKVEDFVTDASFQQWVEGTSPQHTAFWEFWEEAHPEKSETLAQARALLLGLKNQPTAISDDEISLEVEQMVGLVKKKPFWERSILYQWQRIAAVLVVMGAIGGFWMKYRPSEISTTKTQIKTPKSLPKNQEVEVSNNTPADYTTTLPDGSTVKLKKGSKISFPERFLGDKREVSLTGEGFFEVIKKDNQPFYVYTNTLVTRVLGTSFNIKAYSKDEQVVVAVKTGKVMVFPLSELKKSQNNAKYQLQSLYLTPNQKATFERQNERFNKALVEQPVIITQPTETPSFDFENTPIREVFASLKKAYNVEIIYDSDIMKNCSVTAPLGNEPLFVKLDIICKTIGARYEIVETKVFINSRGCH